MERHGDAHAHSHEHHHDEHGKEEGEDEFEHIGTLCGEQLLVVVLQRQVVTVKDE